MKRHQSPLPPIVNKSGEKMSDDSARADLFNQHFFSVFIKEDCSNLDDLKNSLQMLPFVIDSVYFTPEDVYQELCLLDPKNACGPPATY